MNLQGQAPHHQLHQQYLQAQSHIQQQGQYRQQQQRLANTAPGLAQPVMQPGMQQGMRPQQGTRPAGGLSQLDPPAAAVVHALLPACAEPKHLQQVAV